MEKIEVEFEAMKERDAYKSAEHYFDSDLRPQNRTFRSRIPKLEKVGDNKYRATWYVTMDRPIELKMTRREYEEYMRLLSHLAVDDMSKLGTVQKLQNIFNGRNTGLER